ncbi:MAG: DUF3021 domain-containing protein [Lachnospiraceae bacterium]|nr:DUF3021 domain-containing protein [Lachnospiraceae bacterium]
MSKKNKLTLWERYLTKEIGIEFKACLYFFAILFFYCMYRLTQGIFDAGMLHMAEMILAAYIIGYLQVYVFWNFDEADSLGGREWLGLGVCTAIYSLLSYFLKWFDKNIWVTAGFAAYVVLMYVCVFFIYKSKRRIDDKKLNEDLKLFQAGHKTSGDKES